MLVSTDLCASIAMDRDYLHQEFKKSTSDLIRALEVTLTTIFMGLQFSWWDSQKIRNQLFSFS